MGLKLLIRMHRPPDGKRFYILAPADEGNNSEFVIVQNWIEELRSSRLGSGASQVLRAVI